MKLVLKIIGMIVGLLVALVVVQMIASESGEVVVVTTSDDQETRLWVVEHDGSDWLRSGTDAAGWYQRMQANPGITYERAGTTVQASVATEPSETNQINKLMNDKYGWADDFIGLLFGRDSSVALRITPT